MNVRWAIIADDHIQDVRTGKNSLIGIFHNVGTPGFPSRHPKMSLVMQLEASPMDRGKSRHIEVRLVDEDGQELMKLQGDIDVPSDTPVDQAIPMVVAFELNGVEFKGPGRHRFDIFVDGDPKNEVTFSVTQSP